MAPDCIERRNGSFYVVGSRVPLHLIVHEYKEGRSVEGIRECFPTLSIEQVHGALAFYHANKADVEADIEKNEELWEEFRKTHPVPPELQAKLDRARQRFGQRG
jgi:uncharacterized protein (DUF433 family)